MMKKTLGTMIAELRKQNGMTQLELAEKMGVTDKAVSKWERDLSCPDINSLPNLAQILGVSVEELMQTKKEAQALGWESKKGNLWKVAKGCSIGGDRFGNYEGLLPDKKGRKWTECDIERCDPPVHV